MNKMKQLILALLLLSSLAPLVSASNTTYQNTLLCFLKIYCIPTNNTITVSNVPIAKNTTGNSTLVIQNTTLTTLGTSRLTFSTPGQYGYSISLTRTNNSPTGIYSFALLGSFNGGKVYVPSAFSSCEITNKIDCTATFLVNLGAYNSIEVINNGQWLYSIKLNSKVILTPPTPIVQVEKGIDYIPYIFWGSMALIFILIIGNIAYLRWKEAELYNVH